MDKQQWILKTIMDEVIDEINERASDDKEGVDAVLSLWFSKCAIMLEWVATGTIPEAEREDEFLSGFLAIENKPEMQALDA